MVLFVDRNRYLVEKVSGFLPAVIGDAVEVAMATPHAVICSASNPCFTFGGGLDLAIAEAFPYACNCAKANVGVNQKIGNVIFTVTVDENLVANERLVTDAVRFAIESTGEGELLILTGLGTGIGGLPEDSFVGILRREVEKVSH